MPEGWAMTDINAEPPIEAMDDGLPGLVPLFCPRCGGKMGQVETADFCLQCEFVEIYP